MRPEQVFMAVVVCLLVAGYMCSEIGHVTGKHSWRLAGEAISLFAIAIGFLPLALVLLIGAWERFREILGHRDV